MVSTMEKIARGSRMRQQFQAFFREMDSAGISAETPENMINVVDLSKPGKIQPKVRKPKATN